MTIGVGRSAISRAVPPAGTARPKPAVAVAGGWRANVVLTACALAMAAAVLAARVVYDRAVLTDPGPWVRSVDVYHLFVDDTPLRITVTAGWHRIPHTTTPDGVRGDLVLWRRMFTQDWDTVPPRLRAQGLDAMLDRYRPLLAAPAVWDRMTAHDWDLVPHPVRALAFRHMVQYWAGYYHVGAPYALSASLVADTAAAIVMSESWFDHRAVHVNPWGNRDLGLAQASDGARQRVREWFTSGASDVLLEDDDYFNPWNATRFVALWMASLLDGTHGDLEAAVRAYHCGIRRALEGDGEAYARAVFRRADVYLRGGGPSPSWRYLLERDREITRIAWPWLRARRVLGPAPRQATMALDRPGDAFPTWWRLALTRAPSLP